MGRQTSFYIRVVEKSERNVKGSSHSDGRHGNGSEDPLRKERPYASVRSATAPKLGAVQGADSPERPHGLTTLPFRWS